MSRFTDKVVLVSGAGSGIGRATAKLFAAEGALVVAADLVEFASDVIAEFGDDPLMLPLDVRKREDWDRVAHAVMEKFGRLDVLVNVAGVNHDPTAPKIDPSLEDMSLDFLRNIFAVNIEGTVLGTQIGISLMRKSGGGAIVNVSSIAAHKGWPGRPPYGMSKAAVSQFSKSVAVRCAREDTNIRCNAVLPGPIATPMLVPLSGPAGKRGDGKSGADHVPMKRYGEPEEVGAAILFLASDDASYITGAELVIDGGLMAS
jgi:NAD(P)-dependent dehydrogenase (short-subunit alcohol dehydrogenase family)